ncbi:MAG: calcium-translocating P-type ATPase, PMCA-type [Ruminiclostridium sp.]|nr:calcium-translocating P-type ATPase, PMCA-type [Ruminiclostridium sp.]
MNPYSSKPDELLHHLQTNPEKGLSSQSVQKLLQEYGENRLKEGKKKTNLQRFFDQFKDVMILILLAAAVISFIVAIVERNPSEFIEPLLILLIVVLNALMGVFQESKAEKALEALKNLSAPHARVVRDGREMVIDAAGLVPGDIILIEAGDFIPADARLLKSASLKSEESALTGESVPSEKDAYDPVKENASIGDRHNMVYSGCSITYGRARAVVTATGMNTEVGKIANLLAGAEDTKTPLQEKLAQLGKYLGIIALVACGVIFVVGLVSGMPLMEIFMIAVSLAVSAIPEGLPAIVTIVLSIGVQQMVKKNAIIRRLPAVETLGSASVICSDKTGTLTQNRMTLVKAYTESLGNVEDISKENSPEIRQLLMYGMLCSDGIVEFNGDEVKHIGDPTETAIVFAAHQNGMTRQEYGEKYPRLEEIPFDSDRKAMSVVVRIDGKNIVIVKGAFDVLASKCVAGDIQKARDINDQMGSNALRVIAVAYKEIKEVPKAPKPEALETDLVFMGLVGMIDPPRPEAFEAVKLCRKAGIRPVMITGDHVVTASAIAKDLGILREGDDAVAGVDLSAMSDETLDNRVGEISVYARVSPEDKIRIVRAWQKKGHIVAMTGDGVNDAPALKAADIGCAMGITGTDVAKGASDMTLTDDNFATIVEAVKQGRGIYDNIKKAVAFLLGTNIGELLTVFFAMLIWRKSPLLSMQLLWINLVTDSLPAIALGMENVETDVMNRKPKPKDESIFANGLLARVLFQGAMFAALTLFGFWYGEKVTGNVDGGRTTAFIILALTQVVHSFNMRSAHSLFTIGPFTNRKLNVAALVSIILIVLVVFIPPIANIFGLIPLPGHLYLKAVGLAFIPLPVLEITKLLGLIKHRHH